MISMEIQLHLEFKKNPFKTNRDVLAETHLILHPLRDTEVVSDT